MPINGEASSIRGFHSSPTWPQLDLNSRSNSKQTQAELKEELGLSTVNAQNEYFYEFLFVHVFMGNFGGVGDKSEGELE